MKSRLIVALICATLLVPQASSARDATGVVELRSAPAALDEAKAYLLFRSRRIKVEHTFLRVPSQSEIDAWQAARKAAYEKALPNLQRRAKGGAVPSIDDFPFDYAGAANTFMTNNNRFLLDGAELRTFLLEVPPGEYVLYGIGSLYTCNCLGTVSFTARPGVITNIGTIYAGAVHEQSPVSALESNLGPSMFRTGAILGQALVPPSAADALPEVLRQLPVETAQLHVVGPFHDRFAVSINRLAPIPGVLAYERGKVVDVRARDAVGDR